MPSVIVQANNANLTALGKGAQKTAISEVVDEIDDVSELMRDKNNLILGKSYRLDAKPMPPPGPHDVYQLGDYKLDIQTVTQQKSQSTTVAVVFLSAHTPQTSLPDLQAAFTNCLATQAVYRVS